MLDLVGNPEDQFSCVAAQIMIRIISFLFQCRSGILVTLRH